MTINYVTVMSFMSHEMSAKLSSVNLMSMLILISNPTFYTHDNITSQLSQGLLIKLPKSP